jgi:ariadne-1
MMDDSDDGMLSMDDMSNEDEDEGNDEGIDDEYIINLDPEPVGSKVKTDDDFSCEVVSADKVVLQMTEIIRDVNVIIQIPPTSMRTLLNHFKWDKEKLMESYYSGDQDKLFIEAHIVSPFRQSTRSDVVHEVKQAADHYAAASCQVFCDICFDHIPVSTLTGLECGHKFCEGCWRQYLTIKIMDEGMAQTISCPAHGCDILVDDGTVIKLVYDPKVRLKYQQIITNHFVASNRLYRWCPKADCGHAIKALYWDSKPVTCACGYTFCFGCGETWHDPVQCKWLKIWIKKCDDDSETSNWLAANAKECPMCHSAIEKDGGCNHIVCKQCKFDFCWVCLTAWQPHGSSWYNCNRFDEDEAKKARDAQEKSRAALHRYLFYCNRYMNHMQSLKFENKLYTSIQERMERMQQFNMSWIEVQFLKKAVDCLCLCRQTLMYTYVFAFYLSKNNQSIIFEDNQRDLEHATEQLSEYLERDITQDMLVDIKQKVQDKSRYCESRRKVLLDHVHEGYEKDLWDYDETVVYPI